MSYEVRIGLLAAITIVVTVWGYKFMKGKNLLQASNTYYVEYKNIAQLTATSPVMIRGLRVGTVTSTKLTEGMDGVIATIDIDKDIKIPVGTEAVVVSLSIMGGKAIVLDIKGTCAGDDCYARGSYLPGRIQGLFESLVGEEDFNEFVDNTKSAISEIFGSLSDSLTNPETASEIAQSFRDIQMILANIEGITRQLDQNMASYDREVKATLGNVASFSGMLANQNDEIAATLGNLRKMTDDLVAADLGSKVSDIAISADSAAIALQGTLQRAEQTLHTLNGLISEIQQGNGTLGRLMQDEELYENLTSAADNLDLLLQDFRLNPKRYVNVSVFGKKQREYAVPENDPAHQDTVRQN